MTWEAVEKKYKGKVGWHAKRNVEVCIQNSYDFFTSLLCSRVRWGAMMITICEEQWDVILSDIFSNDIEKEKYLQLADGGMMEANLGHMCKNELVGLNITYAKQMFETDLYSRFNSQPVLTQESYKDIARRFAIRYLTNTGDPKEVLRVAILAWIDEETGSTFLDYLRPSIKRSDSISSVESVDTPRSISVDESSEEECFSISNIIDIPAFCLTDIENQNPKKRKAEDESGKSAKASDPGRIVNEIGKLRKIAEELVEIICER